MNIIEMSPLGDSAIVVTVGDAIERKTHQKVQLLSTYLEDHPIPGMIEYVSAFTSVTIFYDNYKVFLADKERSFPTPYEFIRAKVEEALARVGEISEYEPKVVEIPVCYGGEHGADLEVVAKHNGLTPEEVIQIHSEGEYLTYMIGFAPGFPYLGGLSEKIATPRRENPRLAIPAGTVGIAGEQTGVYPIETPGGWQLIGRTPLRLFRPEQWPPTLLQAGNIVKFKPITNEEYDELFEKERSN
ncbi:5-oxoprolinase subunit PxpB [Halalkalibacterium ligniniphilum]|uniref:5-oxoprolinase subunit PxpB n=1 Tax=Halalkalibacterium ligniniphilum TaxID=1134413 RepID=UPI000475DB37|nr:5-oxoprolinase subunit PxpB [Halalkalibacterium ligniniphilum]